MNIFYDVHTYLILSFVGMIFLIAKYAFKRVNVLLDSSVDSIRSKVEDLKQKKSELEQRLKKSDSEIEKVQVRVNKKVLEAEDKASEIYAKSLEDLEIETVNLKHLYKSNLEKLLRNTDMELQQKVSNLIIQSIRSRMQANLMDRDMQNQLIERSIDILYTQKI